MTLTYATTGQLYRPFAESVPPPRNQLARPYLDPPIYRTLIRLWSERGRTLPGRHDPEWVRLTAPPTGTGSYGGGGRDPLSAMRAPQGDGR